MDHANNDEFEKLEPAYQDAIKRAFAHLDEAATFAVLVGLDRDFFLEGAGRAYDFFKRWHDACYSEKT